MAHLSDQRGFTLMELLVASVCTTIVLGGAVALTSQIQNGYRKQMEDSVGEQEARYALEWINRYLRSAGANVFGATDSTCPAVGTQFKPIQPDPNGDLNNNDIAVQADVNPPDKFIGGVAPTCNQKNENVKISLNTTAHEIQFEDIGTGDTSTTRTDSVIEDLQFSYRDMNNSPWTYTGPTSLPNIYYVTTTITIRTRTGNAASATTTRSLSSTVRVRDR